MTYLKSHVQDLIRISLAIVYIWFGILKILGVSPVAGLVIHTYPSYPEPFFLSFLGFWEVIIGIGFATKFMLRATIILMLLQMAGIFCGVIISPNLYFQNGNLFLLSANGEFVVKNFVLVAASLLLWPVKKNE